MMKLIINVQCVTARLRGGRRSISPILRHRFGVSNPQMQRIAASRGALILFEGVDKSGKSTQVRELVQKLRQNEVPVVEMKFPDRKTEVGTLLDRFLSQKIETHPDLEHLLFVSNRFEKRGEILEHLNKGKTIVIDRYAYSGAAYTMAKKIEGLDLHWCKGIEAGKMPAPDVLFFMDLPIDAAAMRSGYGGEKYEETQFQKEVKDAYREVMKGEPCTTIDGSRPVKEISAEVFSTAMNMIEVCRSGRAIRHLWQQEQ